MAAEAFFIKSFLLGGVCWLRGSATAGDDKGFFDEQGEAVEAVLAVEILLAEAVGLEEKGVGAVKADAGQAEEAVFDG